MGDWRPVVKADLEARLQIGSGRDAILQSCVEMCNEMRVSPQDFVNQVESVCLAMMQGEVTREVVDTVRKELQREAKKRVETAFKVHSKDSLSGLSPAYTSPTTNRVAGTSPATPQRSGFNAGQRRMPPSPLTPSPASETTLRYRDRAKKGQSAASLKNLQRALASSISLLKGEASKRRIGMQLFHEQAKTYRYMSEKSSDRADALEDLMHDRTQALVEVRGFPEPLHPSIPRQSEFATIGRICAEPTSSNGQLEGEGAVFLEPSRDFGGSARVRLDLSKLERFSIFSGQVVGVEGMNTSGQLLTVTKLVQGAPAPVQKTSWSKLLEHGHGTAEGGLGGAPMRLLVACGPFTLDDNLDFEPLHDLLNVVRQDPPDVLILGGPFIDASHPLIESANIPVSIDHLLYETVVSRINDAAETHKGTHFIVLPSIDDVTHPFPLLPQPPLARAAPSLEGWSKSIILYPNPASFSLNEIVLSMGTADVLHHLGEAILQRRAQGDVPDAMAARAEHVLDQRSLYPIIPHHVTVPVAPMQMQAIELPVTPDILLLPSGRAPPFVKIVGAGATVAVNPGKLCKGRAGGTYAKLTVYPISKEDAPADEATPVPHRVSERIEAEVVHI